MRSDRLIIDEEMPTCPAGSDVGILRRDGQRGITLIEIVLTFTIAGTLIIVALMLVRSVAGASESISEGLETTRTNIDFMAALRRSLNEGRIESISSDGATLTYSLPMQSAEDGSKVNRSGEVIWAITDDEDVTTNRVITLAFVVDRLLKESAIGKDVNNDGDMVDVFDVGHVTMTSSLDGVRPLPRLYIVLRNGGHGGDVTGDGVDDPLFSVDPDSLEVEISISRLADSETLKSLVTYCGVVDNTL